MKPTPSLFRKSRPHYPHHLILIHLSALLFWIVDPEPLFSKVFGSARYSQGYVTWLFSKGWSMCAQITPFSKVCFQLVFTISLFQGLPVSPSPMLPFSKGLWLFPSWDPQSRFHEMARSLSSQAISAGRCHTVWNHLWLATVFCSPKCLKG